MRKPTIDELLKKEESIYTLTMLAARRARQLKILDREVKLPLQQALDEIAGGSVTADYADKEIDDLKLIEQFQGREEHHRSEYSQRDDRDSDRDPRNKQQTLFPSK